jgi:hypothetical protein
MIQKLFLFMKKYVKNSNQTVMKKILLEDARPNPKISLNCPPLVSVTKLMILEALIYIYTRHIFD